MILSIDTIYKRLYFELTNEMTILKKVFIMTKIILIASLSVAILFIAFASNSQDAMKTCQEMRSYETCHNTLVR